jgi:hypothetical protein
MKIGHAVASPHMGEVVGYRYFILLFLTFLGHAHSRYRALAPTYYISIDTVWPKDVPLGFQHKKYLGELLPKTPLLGREWGFPA